MKPKLRKIRKAGPKKRKQRRAIRPLFSLEDVGPTIELPLSWLFGEDVPDEDDETPRGTYTITSIESGSTVQIVLDEFSTPWVDTAPFLPMNVGEKIKISGSRNGNDGSYVVVFAVGTPAKSPKVTPIPPNPVYPP